MKYVPPIGAADGAPYVDANPAAGIEGSLVPAAAIEHPQREIMNVIQEAGLDPDGNDLTQLAQAIIGLIATHSPTFTTGDVKLTMKTVADPGWVMMNDGSIGNAGSGATTRANADTEALFTLLWNNVDNAWAPVQDSAGSPIARGTSAAADFAAGRRLVLPRTLGRALAVAGGGAGLTARALGQYVGSETHTLTTAELPSHTHPYREMFNGPVGVAGGSQFFYSTYNATTGATGSGSAHNNMQPTAFLNVMIKL